MPTSGRTGCWGCGGKGLPEAGKGTGRHSNRALKIRFRTTQYGYYFWQLLCCPKVYTGGICGVKGSYGLLIIWYVIAKGPAGLRLLLCFALFSISHCQHSAVILSWSFRFKEHELTHLQVPYRGVHSLICCNRQESKGKGGRATAPPALLPDSYSDFTAGNNR